MSSAAWSGNACQPAAGISCGACCGLFNLKLSDNPAEAAAARAEILRERSRAFSRVRFDVAEDFVAYRAAREGREGAILRHDSEPYVCPFYGPLTSPEPEQRSARPDVPEFRADAADAAGDAVPALGCMAHPLRTGLKHTQNFSFYGASICQAYDCRNKDQDPQGYYSRLLVSYVRSRDWDDALKNARGVQNVFKNGPADNRDERYTRLMADLPLFAFLERVPGLLERLCESADAAASLADWERPPLREFAALARARLASRHTERVTSFEIELSRYPDLRSELGALLNEPGESGGAILDVLCDETDNIYRGLCEPGPPAVRNTGADL